MTPNKRNVILTHVPNDDQWPYCQLMSKETGREFHVEYMSTGNGNNHLRCLFCYVFFPLLVFLRRHRYDYIVAQQQFYGLMLAFYCRLFHVRKDFHIFVLTFIYLPKAGVVGRIYRRFMRYIVQSPYIDFFTVHSTAEPSLYASQLGVSADRFHFVPLGMNAFPAQPDIPDMQRQRYILAVGRSNRDYDFLVDTLRNTDYQLHIICDTYHRTDITANIHIHNDIFDQMPLWLHNCHCVVIPLRDPMVSSGQLVLLQAMQMGKPLIVTRSAALNDYINPGRNALVIDNSPEQLLQALDQLYHDTALYHRLSEAGRNGFQQRHSAEAQVISTAHLIKRVCLTLLMALGSNLIAQTRHSLDLSTEAAVGTGPYTAHYLTANRHGILSTRSNTGYLRADYQVSKEQGDWQLSAGLDVQLSAHTHQHSAIYLQQAYLQARWRFIDMRVGSREIGPMLRDGRLSSGSTIWSGNARPIPGLYLGFSDFVDIPLTRHWLQFYIDGSYGYYMDSDYQQSQYDQYIIGKTGYGRSYLATQVWSHQKRAALRTRPDRPLVFTFSCDHAVQFGGKSVNYIDESLSGSYPPHFKDFFTVLMPLHGDDGANSGDKAFVYGNHIGNLAAMFEYQWDKDYTKKVGIYLEDPFDDGSGIRKGNGMDGLWGIEYHNYKPNAWVSGIVLEYLQTTDQSGPIHWAPSDFKGQEIADVAHAARGADDYYNNFFYTGYSHFGQACGSPLIKSPAYNADHYLRFTDNRIKAWHLGIEGQLWSTDSADRQASSRHLRYRILASQRRSWGTYFNPSPDIRRATSFLAELTYGHNAWQCTLCYAQDHGDLLGNNHTLGFKVNYHL